MGGARDLGYDDDFTADEIRSGAAEAARTGDTETAASMLRDADQLEGK